MNIQLKDQRCNVTGLALSWFAYAAGVAYFGHQRRWVPALLWTVAVPVLRWVLFRFFRQLSRFLGYGRIVDRAISMPLSNVDRDGARVVVNFYSFFSCPFCPIVLARLHALQEKMGFTLNTFDVTLRPQMLMKHGIRSVPVVEAGGHRLVGNSTTEQLVGLIAPGSVPKFVAAD